jgi:hypothetical protein
MEKKKGFFKGEAKSRINKIALRLLIMVRAQKLQKEEGKSNE